MKKAIFVPGNGGCRTVDGWFSYLNAEFTKMGINVVAEEFPDPMLARREYWIPFLEKLGTDPETILVGHSSGAVAAMRYAENHAILGSILVAACHTDLGIESEKESGYFDDPWNWDAIKKNQKWIALFASSDDPCIAIEEARYVRDKLQPTYFEFTDRGHFSIEKLPEAVEFVGSKLAQQGLCR
jgi:hypothetical protein